MSKYLFLLSCLMPFSLAAQQRISGKVMSKENKPIAHASIAYLNHKYGITTESDGSFDMQKFTGDSVRIFALGYKPLTIPIQETTTNINSILQNDTAVLQEVNVKMRASTNKITEIGYYSRKVNYFINVFSFINQVGIFINNSEQIQGYIDEIKFRLGKYENANCSIRVRLLTIDSTTRMPKDDLLFYDNIIPKEQLARDIIFSIKSKAILFPKQGVFVVLECMPNEASGINNKVFPILLGFQGGKENNTYFNFANTNWTKSGTLNKSDNSNKPSYNVASVSLIIGHN